MLSEGRGETPAPPLLQGFILSRMASTSINIQPCKIGSSEQHNERTKPLDYVRSELSHLNEHWQSDDKTLSQHLSEVQRAYQQAKGKRMHAKATPIREGVIVIQQSTTMEDLQRFAKACEERWGIKALQIHTHKDEGYMHAKEWTPNLHAHIVWRWTDEEGVTRKLNRFDMVEMQTLLADTLGMERGVASDKKHLSSLQFKNEAEAKRLAETQNKLQEATKDLGEVENIRERIESAVEAKIKPIEAILDENTTKTLFGGRKTDYEAVIGKIKAQEEAKAIVKVSEQTAKDIKTQEQIRELEERLRLSQREAEQVRQDVEQKNKDLFTLAHFLRGYLRDGFEEFKEECQGYFQRKFNKVLELSTMVLMWAGKVIRDNLGNQYTADYEQARLLINGKTIEQHEAQELENRTMKGKDQGTTNNRMKR